MIMTFPASPINCLSRHVKIKTTREQAQNKNLIDARWRTVVVRDFAENFTEQDVSRKMIIAFEGKKKKRTDSSDLAIFTTQKQILFFIYCTVMQCFLIS